MVAKRDPVAEFLTKKPDLAKDYLYIHPVSLDLPREFERLHRGSVNRTSSALTDRFGKVEGMSYFVSDFAALMTWIAIAREIPMSRFYDELTEASKGGGVICEYTWSDGETIETGLMVLKDGNIVNRPTPFTGRTTLSEVAAFREKSPVQTNPVAEFLCRLPAEKRKGYVYVHPVNVHFYKLQYSWNGGALASEGEFMKARFGKLEGMADFARSVQDRANRAEELWEHDCDELTEASRGGGAVCEYKWSFRKTLEVGLFVLKGGRIVKRFPFSYAPDWEKLAESGPTDDGEPGEPPVGPGDAIHN